jgi:hypothetical protein
MLGAVNRLALFTLEVYFDFHTATSVSACPRSLLPQGDGPFGAVRPAAGLEGPIIVVVGVDCSTDDCIVLFGTVSNHQCGDGSLESRLQCTTQLR